MYKNKLLAIITIVFIFIIAFSSIKTPAGFAEETIYKSKAYCLMDSTTGQVLVAENETKRLPIASMCKIMTLVLCFDEINKGNISLEDTVTVSDTASSMGGSQIFLETNGNYKVKELIKGIVVASANDACVAMAETICGSESDFVLKMNNKAKELGMENTNFVNATGLPKEGQYSCAIDCATMFNELIKNKEYFEFSKIWMDKIQHPKDRITEISNTNKLIKFYQGCDSGKTGYTQEAGHCLTASAKRNGLRLIGVVISAPDGKTRFNEVSSLFNYGFCNYTSKNIINCDKTLDFTTEIKCGIKDNIQLIPQESFSYLCKKEEKLAFEITFTPDINLKAPINKGDAVGKLSIFKDGVEIKTINVLAYESIIEKEFLHYLKDLANRWKICA